MPSQGAIKQQIQQAIEVLRQGGIVCFPTDTVYGIGASAFIDHAVERIYEAKQRPRSKPLQLLLADKSEMAKIASPVPKLAWLLADQFLPGGLTLVLCKAPLVSKAVTAGGDTVAIRIPNHPVPIALIRGLGAPLAASSANISSRPSPVTAKEVHRQLGTRVDLIIDGGRCPGGIESTVLDVTGEAPRILRQGAVPRQAIEEICQSRVG